MKPSPYHKHVSCIRERSGVLSRVSHSRSTFKSVSFSALYKNTSNINEHRIGSTLCQYFAGFCNSNDRNRIIAHQNRFLTFEHFTSRQTKRKLESSNMGWSRGLGIDMGLDLGLGLESGLGLGIF